MYYMTPFRGVWYRKFTPLSSFLFISLLYGECIRVEQWVMNGICGLDSSKGWRADLVHSPRLSRSTLAAVAYFKLTRQQSCIIEGSERFGPYCTSLFCSTLVQCMHCVGVFNCSQSRIYCYRLHDRHHENVLVTQKLLNVKISTVGVQNEVSVKMCFDMMVSLIVFAKVLCLHR